MGGAPLGSLLRGLAPVGDTAVLTLACRALESRAGGVLQDPLAESWMAELRPVLYGSEHPLHRRIRGGELADDLIAYVALRARRYDGWARTFIERHPDGVIVGLGCGLDTRASRLGRSGALSVGVELPPVAALRRALATDSDAEVLLHRSVLDLGWMDDLAKLSPGPFQFQAEGLFMYLPADGVRRMVAHLAGRFPGSELACEIVHARWVRPPWSWSVRARLRRLGLGVDVRYRFGVTTSEDLERWHPAVQLVEDWAHVDEPDARPAWLRTLRGVDGLRRVQWSARYRFARRR